MVFKKKKSTFWDFRDLVVFFDFFRFHSANDDPNPTPNLQHTKTKSSATLPTPTSYSNPTLVTSSPTSFYFSLWYLTLYRTPAHGVYGVSTAQGVAQEWQVQHSSDSVVCLFSFSLFSWFYGEKKSLYPFTLRDGIRDDGASVCTLVLAHL